MTVGATGLSARLVASSPLSVEDERESEGSTVAEKRSNVRGAKRPCCLQRFEQYGRQG